MVVYDLEISYLKSIKRNFDYCFAIISRSCAIKKKRFNIGVVPYIWKKNLLIKRFQASLKQCHFICLYYLLHSYLTILKNLIRVNLSPVEYCLFAYLFLFFKFLNLKLARRSSTRDLTPVNYFFNVQSLEEAPRGDSTILDLVLKFGWFYFILGALFSRCLPRWELTLLVARGEPTKCFVRIEKLPWVNLLSKSKLPFFFKII